MNTRAVAEKVGLAGTPRTLFHIWSNACSQYRNGTLKENQWFQHLREMRATTDPITRLVWQDWKYASDDSFQHLFDEVLKAASSAEKGFVSKEEESRSSLYAFYGLAGEQVKRV